jgi:hypothetical protein
MMKEQRTKYAVITSGVALKEKAALAAGLFRQKTDERNVRLELRK